MTLEQPSLGGGETLVLGVCVSVSVQGWWWRNTIVSGVCECVCVTRRDAGGEAVFCGVQWCGGTGHAQFLIPVDYPWVVLEIMAASWEGGWMVNGTSFSLCVVTSVITHAVCNSIFSVFRQIWDSNCSFMKGLCSHRKDRWHQSLKRAI